MDTTQKKQLTALEVYDIISDDLKFEGHIMLKANWTGAWDKVDHGDAVKLIKINAGLGLQSAVAVHTNDGFMIYLGPYMLESLPTEEELFLFYCEEGMYISGLDKNRRA